MTGDHGPLRENERDAATDLLGYSFPDEPAFAERARHIRGDRAFAVRRNGTLASVVLWRDTTVLQHHVESTICIAGPGATHPAHRRQGVLAAAQEPFLAAMRDAGCVLSGLETPITRWHRRNGWGIASAVRRYSAPPHAFRLLDPTPAPGEPVFGPDEATVLDVWRTAAHCRFGALLPRPVPDPHPLDLRADTVAWQEDDRPTGLLRYSQRRGHDDQGTSIVVHELHTTSPAAYAGLLGMLSEHNNIDKIVWNAPVDDPLQQLVTEPRDVEPMIISDKMVRIVDLGRLAVPRIDTSEPGGLTIDLHDPQAPWNSGTWEMAGDGEVYRFARTSRRADLHAEVGVLGPVITGHLTATAAATTGRLHGSHPALRLLDHMRAAWVAPYCPDTW